MARTRVVVAFMIATWLAALVVLFPIVPLGRELLDRRDHASLALTPRATISAQLDDVVATVLPDGRTVRAERLCWPALGPLSPRERLWEVDVFTSQAWLYDGDPQLKDYYASFPRVVSHVGITDGRVWATYFKADWVELDIETGKICGGGSD